MLIWLLALACADKGDVDTSPRDTADSGADTAPVDSAQPDDTAPDPCADVPTVTYANFGRGFMTGNCQGCHASSAPDRYDAPEEVSFDDVDQCWAWAVDILAVATGSSPSMPPQGGVTEDDRQKLEWWLTCAEPGT